MDDSLMDVLKTSWKRWSTPSITLKRETPNTYIVLTDRVNNLNHGIYFYMKMNSDGTYSLSDRFLTLNSLIREFGVIKHPEYLAKLAAEYGILLNTRGEFEKNNVGQLDLVSSINNFEETMFEIVDKYSHIL